MSHVSSRRAGGLPLSSPTRDRLAALVREHGEAAVTAKLGLSRAVLARALAGLGLRRGTMLVIDQGLRSLGASK